MFCQDTDNNKNYPSMKMTMKPLPKDVKPYKRTPLFTASTVPKGVLSRHNTKEGTWGLIHVEKGQLRYTIFADQERKGSENRSQDFETILSLGMMGVIEPQGYIHTYIHIYIHCLSGHDGSHRATGIHIHIHTYIHCLSGHAMSH